MYINKFFFKRSLTIILTAGFMFVLSACSTEQSRKTEAYVESVKTIVNESVKNTRILKTQRDNLNTDDSQSLESYISTLDTLSDLYEQLIKLETPDGYEDLDFDLEASAKNGLTVVTQLKTLVKYIEQNDHEDSKSENNFIIAEGAENVNDYFSKDNEVLPFKRDEEELFDYYQLYYDSIVSLSSEIQTRYRNS